MGCGPTRWHAHGPGTLSVAKSAVVVFTLARKPLSESVTQFLLSAEPLPIAPSYKYLGVTFQSNALWSEQADALIRRVTATSAAICRLIAYDRPPGPLAVRTLVQALLLSAVMYAFACWR